MSKRKRHEIHAGGLLLLASLVILNLVQCLFDGAVSEGFQQKEGVFAEVSGHVMNPGVYGFEGPFSIADSLSRAGGVISGKVDPGCRDEIIRTSGARIEVMRNFDKCEIKKGQMSAFYKISLRIPVSVNLESCDGLTAIPGIGPETARRIVRYRDKKGDFSSLEELCRVRGIGPSLLRRVCPYLDIPEDE